MHIRAVRRLTVAFSLVVVQVMALTVPVNATAACGDSQFVSRFDGIGVSGGGFSVWGVQGDIRDRGISLCTGVVGATSGASAWAMLEGLGLNQYAQIGFAMLPGDLAARTFTEYNDGSNVSPGWKRTFWSGIFTPGTNHTYKVEYSFATGTVGMWVDGVSKDRTPWSANVKWSAPYFGEFEAETLDRGDDVPGTSGYRTQFRSLKQLNCSGCAYATANPNYAGSDLGVYKFQWVTPGGPPSHFDVWTER